MLTKDKTAVVDYLEFALVNFVQKYEQHLDEDVIGAFYADAYGLLSDFDDTLQSAVESTTLTRNTDKS